MAQNFPHEYRNIVSAGNWANFAIGGLCDAALWKFLLTGTKNRSSSSIVLSGAFNPSQNIHGQTRQFGITIPFQGCKIKHLWNHMKPAILSVFLSPHGRALNLKLTSQPGCRIGHKALAETLSLGTCQAKFKFYAIERWASMGCGMSVRKLVLVYIFYITDKNMEYN